MLTDTEINQRHLERVADALMTAGVGDPKMLSLKTLHDLQELHRLDWVAHVEERDSKKGRSERKFDQVAAINERLHAERDGVPEHLRGVQKAMQDVLAKLEGDDDDDNTAVS